MLKIDMIKKAALEAGADFVRNCAGLKNGRCP